MVETAQAGHNFLDPFLKAGLFAQVILVLLFLASVVTWAIIVKKWRTIARARRETRQFISLFSQTQSLANCEPLCRQFRNSPLSALLLSGIKEWKGLETQVQKTDAGRALLQQLIPNVAEAMERSASREYDRLEASLPFLAVTTMVAPFLGLLGTVQGVLKTFLALRGEQLPSLQLIAPGISDALVTTVVGLLVAIPAAFFYNYFVGRVRDLGSEMERFVSELVGIFRKESVLSQLNRTSAGQ